MQIKSVKVNKKEALVTWNNDQELSISINTYLDLVLYKGQEITVKEVKKRDNYFRCLDKAIKLCRRKDFSSSKIKHTLLDEYEEKIVKDVIKRLKELNLINDDVNANKIINKCINKNMGVHKIEQVLMLNGYDDHYIDKDVINSSRENIDKCAQKYIKTHSRYEPKKLKQNLYRYLQYQGYDSESIYSYMSRMEVINND